MSIFICWSGDRSHGLATALKTLLEATLETEVFVSDDIDKGALWFDTIAGRLEQCKAGIVCLTPENVGSDWLHFEAGALAHRVAARSRLFTLLHGVSPARLAGPLSAYQATSTTEADMTEMIRGIGEVLRVERDGATDRDFKLEPTDWTAFSEAVAHISIPARRLIPELAELFQRKTFNEPLHRCPDQAWTRRYDGARVTHEKLLAYVDRVRAACSPHEQGLFEMLLAELDGYAAAMQALLLRPRRFELAAPGELNMDPGIRTCCEDRRLAIRSLAGRLLHPLDEPLRPEAVRFMAAETHEERKMIVHRLEGAIRRERDVAFDSGRRPVVPGIWAPALRGLIGTQKAIRYRESSWDLDRIYYYLLVEYFDTAALRWAPDDEAMRAAAAPETPLLHDWLCAARDVAMEVERYRARSKGGSLIPLIYALTALRQVNRQPAPDANAAGAAVASAVDLVSQEFRDIDLDSDAGRSITRLLDQIRRPESRGAASSDVQAVPPPVPLPTRVHSRS